MKAKRMPIASMISPRVQKVIKLVKAAPVENSTTEDNESGIFGKSSTGAKHKKRQSYGVNNRVK